MYQPFAATILYCIDSAYADEFASVIKHLWRFCKTIISEMFSNVDTKDRSDIHNQVGEY